MKRYDAGIQGATPAQVKTEKTARHLQAKKVKFLHFFTLIYRADLAIVMIK